MPRVVAIIPARGGSVRIPRKNCRLLAGKPLIAHTIDTALAAATVDAIFVSTDDDEIAEIARRWGVGVVVRPAALAEPQVGLCEVVAHAVKQVEQGSEAIDLVVTLQPTSPLLSSRSVDTAVQRCLDTGCDTVTSVTSARHAAWSVGDDGVMRLDDTVRHVSEDLRPSFRETGGVVVCRRAVLEGGTRFGAHVEAVVLDKTESVDIDDHFDWWLAEKSLYRAHICFHVLGSRVLGMGHVYRSLTLADRLIDHEVSFVVDERSGLAAEKIRERFYALEVVPTDGVHDALLKAAPDVIVHDVLDTDTALMSVLKQAGIVNVTFEDRGPGSHLADLVINSMYEDAPHPGSEARVLAGPALCVLRDEFYSVAPAEFRSEVQRVLLVFGGTDPNALSLRCLRWVDAVEGDWDVTIICGLGFTGIAKVHAYAAKARHAVTVIQDTPMISSHMVSADVAITSAGRTVFELASLGVPMITVAQNPRESTHTFARTSPGVIYMGPVDELGEQAVSDVLRQLLVAPLLRRKMREILLASDLAGGSERVLSALRRLIADRVFDAPQ